MAENARGDRAPPQTLHSIDIINKDNIPQNLTLSSVLQTQTSPSFSQDEIFSKERLKYQQYAEFEKRLEEFSTKLFNNNFNFTVPKLRRLNIGNIISFTEELMQLCARLEKDLKDLRSEKQFLSALSENNAVLSTNQTLNETSMKEQELLGELNVCKEKMKGLEAERIAFLTKLKDLESSLKNKESQLMEKATNDLKRNQNFEKNFEKLKANENKWKNLYLNEAKNFLKVQKSYKGLIEDLNCHMEYITVLEKKVEKVEAKYYELYSDHHQKLTESRIKNLKLTLSYIDEIKQQNASVDSEYLQNMTILKSFEGELNIERERSCDLKNQLSSLIAAREDLSRNLTLSRTQNMELSERLEEEAAKVLALEDMRIADLQYMLNLETTLEMYD